MKALFAAMIVLVALRVDASSSLLEGFGVTPIPPDARIVQFQQILFDYEVTRIVDSDWGRIQIDGRRLLRFTAGCEGYVNVFVLDVTGRMAWVVDNVFVAGPDDNKCSGVDEKGLAVARSKDPFPASSYFRRRRYPGNIPVVKYLDLRPGEEGAGRLLSISAVVWFSRSPVPNAHESLGLAESSELMGYRVGRVLENAEGDLIGSRDGQIGRALALGGVLAKAVGEGDVVADRVAPGPSKLAIGPPPQPVLTKTLAELGNILFPIGVFQAATPNVNSGRNQCVPIAHANALAYR